MPGPANAPSGRCARTSQSENAPREVALAEGQQRRDEVARHLRVRHALLRRDRDPAAGERMAPDPSYRRLEHHPSSPPPCCGRGTPSGRAEEQQRMCHAARCAERRTAAAAFGGQDPDQRRPGGTFFRHARCAPERVLTSSRARGAWHSTCSSARGVFIEVEVGEWRTWGEWKGRAGPPLDERTLIERRTDTPTEHHDDGSHGIGVSELRAREHDRARSARARARAARGRRRRAGDARRSRRPRRDSRRSRSRACRQQHLVDPVGEAERWARSTVERLEAVAATRVVIVGLGLGYHVEALAARFAGTIVVVEPDLAVLRAALAARDLRGASRARRARRRATRSRATPPPGERALVIAHAPSLLIPGGAHRRALAVVAGAGGAERLALEGPGRDAALRRLVADRRLRGAGAHRARPRDALPRPGAVPRRLRKGSSASARGAPTARVLEQGFCDVMAAGIAATVDAIDPDLVLALAQAPLERERARRDRHARRAPRALVRRGLPA